MIRTIVVATLGLLLLASPVVATNLAGPDEAVEMTPMAEPMSTEQAEGETCEPSEQSAQSVSWQADDIETAATDECLNQMCPWINCGSCVRACWRERLEQSCNCTGSAEEQAECRASAQQQFIGCALSCGF